MFESCSPFFVGGKENLLFVCSVRFAWSVCSKWAQSNLVSTLFSLVLVCYKSMRTRQANSKCSIQVSQRSRRNPNTRRSFKRVQSETCLISPWKNLKESILFHLKPNKKQSSRFWASTWFGGIFRGPFGKVFPVWFALSELVVFVCLVQISRILERVCSNKDKTKRREKVLKTKKMEEKTIQQTLNEKWIMDIQDTRTFHFSNILEAQIKVKCSFKKKKVCENVSKRTGEQTQNRKRKCLINWNLELLRRSSLLSTQAFDGTCKLSARSEAILEGVNVSRPIVCWPLWRAMLPSYRIFKHFHRSRDSPSRLFGLFFFFLLYSKRNVSF